VVVALTNFFNRSSSMRKNVLALSIATMIGGLGFAGFASASVIVGSRPTASDAPANNSLRASNANSFLLSDGGVGHQLITPYFNAQNGNGTVLHVVNTDTVNGKALKVRFRGASNSDDILDFYVLLSPGDVWTGLITQGASGFATLATADKSCTYPAIPSGGKSFVPNRLNPSWTSEQKQNNTREGYVEMFVAADIPSDAVYSGAANAQSALYTTIKHVNGVAPCKSEVLGTALLTDLNEAAAARVGFDTPTGKVAGSWYIINVPESTTFSGDMTALRAVNIFSDGGFSYEISARGNYVVFPQTDQPVAGAPETFTADPLLSGGSNSYRTKGANGATDNVQPTPLIKAAMYDFPDLSTPYLGGIPGGGGASVVNARNSAASLTKQLAARNVSNQYATDPSISAKTDWTFSFPTRRYSVAYDYSASGSTLPTVYSLVPATGDQYFHDSNIVADTGAAQLCINLGSDGLSFYDREETTNTSGPIFSPGEITSTRFCGETSVLSFKDTGKSALGASVARSTITGDGPFTNGWAFLNTTGTNGLGLPLIGSAFLKLTNPNATPGVAGNYGITWKHINNR
jgi:hypothetical protein